MNKIYAFDKNINHIPLLLTVMVSDTIQQKQIDVTNTTVCIELLYSVHVYDMMYHSPFILNEKNWIQYMPSKSSPIAMQFSDANN